MAFRVAEALGHERSVTVQGEPRGGQFVQAQTEALAGEIGAAGLFEDEETAELDDELAMLGDELAKAVSRLTSGTEEMLFVEHGVGDLPIRGGLGEMDFQRPANRRIRAELGIQIRNHDSNAVISRSFV